MVARNVVEKAIRAFVIGVISCTEHLRSAQEIPESTDSAECKDAQHPVTLRIDYKTLKAPIRCGTGFTFLWPDGSSSAADTLTRFCEDAECSSTGELSTFGSKSSLTKDSNARESSLSYTLALETLPEEEKSIHFKCAREKYTTRKAEENNSCLLTVVVPSKSKPTEETCDSKKQSLDLAISAAGGSVTFACGVENSNLLPTEKRVFSEDCQTDQALDAGIPSAKLSSTEGAHTLSVPELPKAGTTICYKCVDKADKVTKQCSVKVRVSGAESSRASIRTAYGCVFSGSIASLYLAAYYAY
ncbi:SAG-related sequence [Besnoitia besnoiti]|uniref:SAG-related sequence n=1 Tax=Besnoitia besnoiti TaxID=94643 RepID=A0A2A9MIY7_BESBE|nr:SAG-related sequence [Besnoitia besnoiti]PFH35342.1 SAG-related sequence [Besnoitia besnoiti]